MQDILLFFLILCLCVSKEENEIFLYNEHTYYIIYIFISTFLFIIKLKKHAHPQICKVKQKYVFFFSEMLLYNNIIKRKYKYDEYMKKNKKEKVYM
ncbi:hypothetical protein PFTANZ_02085 [Plasmodium falciparum Tanzania (2000708)]|uniref:Uncharacterized protein n=1 Tax=Plasmodium falciparum Tanzania (2000708) TaxID=1036725 RepID=A0A024W9H7_PLAFA|nr:hypothetical protein PFTANZ_02085 [Plasmodium falciparum Tanzania (2000708)]